MGVLKGYFPILDWGSKYNSKTFSNDMIVALIVTMMLIPQSLAYAILAGLPPEIGLYASIAPLLFYAIFGSSRTLAVGPVAVASLMTAAAVGAAGLTGNTRVPGSSHCPGHGIWFVPDPHRFSETGISCKLSQPPGHLGIYYSFGYPDCCRSAWTCSWSIVPMEKVSWM